MFLKEMKIYGFKSFADKTTIKFTEGMTCIVGPNGCGKSNVTDALRWVFGEQSIKKLRGSRMQDIIFSGTSERKPLNMAEVNILLNNEKRILATDYDEVVIKRRVFSNGDSEYYINNQRCRYKDIQTLVTDTGIGMSAYSFIEQGMISRILSTKSEERRSIFEEAAGIMKYRMRKKETLKKLDSTQENLNRLKDIVFEVERQLKSLSRQVEKAEKYRVKFEKLKEKELIYNKNYFEYKAKERNTLLEMIEKLQKEKAVLMVAINKMNSEIENIQLDLTGKENLLRNLEATLYDKKVLLEKKHSAINNETQSREYLKKRNENLLNELDDMAVLIENWNADIATYKREIKKMEMKVDGIEDSLIEKEDELDSLRKKIAQKEDEHSKKISYLLDAMRNESALSGAIKKFEADLENFEAANKRLNLKNEDIEKKIEESSSKLNELLEFEKKYHDEVAFLEKDILEHDEEYQKYEKLVDNKRKELREVKDKKIKTDALFDSFTLLEQSMDGLKNGTKAVLSEKDRLKIKGLLADFVKVESGYERYVDYVLSDYSELFLLEDNDYKLLQSFVKERQKGEKVLLYSDVVDYADDILHKDSLFNKCSVDNEKVALVLKKLLGKIILTDKDKIEPSLLKKGFTLLDKNGTIVRPDGVMIVGDIEHQGTGIIERKNLRERYGKESEILEKEILKLEKELNDYQKKLDEVKKHLSEANLKKRELLKKIEITKKDMEFLKKTVDRLREEKELNLLEIKNGEKEIFSLNDSLAEYEKKLKLLLEETKLKDSEKKEVEKEIENLRNEYEMGQKEIATLKSTLSNIKSDIAIKKNDIKRIENSIEDTLKKKKKYLTEIDENKEKIERTFEIVKDIEVEIEKLLIDIDKTEKDVRSKKEEVESLRTRLSQLTKEIREKDNKYRDVQDLLNEKELISLRTEDKLAAIKSYILNSYEIDIASYDVKIPQYYDFKETREEIERLKTEIRSLGNVNMTALDEYNDLKGRYEFLVSQKEDLENARNSLEEAIDKIDTVSKEKFIDTFYKIKENFNEIFPRLFGGGKADIKLIMNEDEDVLSAGVDVNVKPPGKRLQNINLLSGGEKALSAIALLFSIFKVKPAPFCVLDEIDAPLDDANISRFINMISEFTDTTQFIIVSHNKYTMEMADALYGVTMDEPGVSKLISVKLKEGI